MEVSKTLIEKKELRRKWNAIHAEAGKLPAVGPEIWSGFDDIVCINLLEREDRYQKAKALFDSLEMPMRFHRVHKHPNGGVEGCYTSHIQVITDAYERGLNNVLIFEDDVAAGKGLNARKVLECSNLAKVPGVQLVYLGWHPQVLNSRTQHVIGSMYGIKAMGCHAYVITREVMKDLANRPFDGTPIDVLLTNYPKAFGVYPTAFVQGMGDSNITDNFSNSKAMKPIRAIAEAYSVNVNVPPKWLLFALILAVVGIILFHLVVKRNNLKPGKLGYVMVFLTFFMFAMFVVSR